MQPATIRRLLVFGVCLAGAGALYLVPGIAGAPVGLDSTSARHDLPTTTPTATTAVPASTSGPVSFTGSPPSAPITTEPTGDGTRADQSPTTGGAGADRRAITTTARRPAATAGAPGRDHTPPSAVGRLTVTRLDPERLTVTWPEAGDDVGVVSYHVWLNGFLVLDTQQTRASLTWFNDSGTHVVQVQALDAVGNQGPSSPTLLVVRPSPDRAGWRPGRFRHQLPPDPTRPRPRPRPRPTVIPPAALPSLPRPGRLRPAGRHRPGRLPMTPMSGPLVVQSDKTLLLEVDHPDADACRMAIAPFAELERAPEHIHTYRLTPLGLWNARAAGHDAEQVVDTLLTYSRYPVPSSLLVDVADTMDRFGRLRLEKHPVQGLVLVSTDRAVLTEVLRSAKVKGLVGARLDDDTVVVHPSERGHLKQVLLKLGWPAEDLAGYVNGEAHEIALDQDGWELRTYQKQAADSFWHGGSGVVVLPCGAGKTIVGAASMAHAQATTLDLGHQHGLRPAVAGRAAPPHHPDRRGDRGVLRGEEGDPTGHHRDLPGHHHQARRDAPAPGAVQRPGLGPGDLRRGAPAARAGVPDDG